MAAPAAAPAGASAPPQQPPQQSQTPAPVAAPSPPKTKTMLHHLVAGGTAGFVESSIWCVWDY